MAARAARTLFKPWWVDEPQTDVLLSPTEAPKGFAIFHGYWQSPLYFAGISQSVRRELLPDILRSSPAYALLQKFSKRQTIAVHVRRGDYAQDQQVQASHGTLDAEYYTVAVQSMAAVEDNAVAFVLSDDPAWAMQNLKLDVEAVHVGAKWNMSAWETLALMSRCKHHVIANSSFSWWGAWLAEHQHQHVIYPIKWFATRPVQHNFRFPTHWTSQ
jgi:hypothetical protein